MLDRFQLRILRLDLVQANVAFDGGDDLVDGLGEEGVAVSAAVQPVVEAVLQDDGVSAAGGFVDGRFELVADSLALAADLASALGDEIFLATRLSALDAGLLVVLEMGFQGENLPHGAGDAGEAQIIHRLAGGEGLLRLGVDHADHVHGPVGQLFQRDQALVRPRGVGGGWRVG